ncbi:MAG: 30S ribosomal protein S3 [Succinivibrionaceae bacterium]|nr:30S ribosomal protein S3 [Succinivibrionaceae bacterium]
MGQKINPNGIRLGITKQFTSNWYANSKEYAQNLASDFKVRQHLMETMKDKSVSRIQIERFAKSIKVNISTARPGLVWGQRGESIEKIRNKITAITGVAAQINVSEIRKPDLDSKLVADSIAQQLENRVMFRRAMKKAIKGAMSAGAQGVKIEVSGRLGGAEIARSEWIREGRVPLHTLRADIDYAVSEARTTYGVIGIKVWIFKGEVLGGIAAVEAEQAEKNSAPKNKRGKGRGNK